MVRRNLQRDDEHLLSLREGFQKSVASDVRFYDISAKKLHSDSERGYNSFFRRIGAHESLFSG